MAPAAILPVSVFSSATAKAADRSYKALVVIEFEGGNDTLNMFPPIQQTNLSTGFDHDTYSRLRPKLGVANALLDRSILNAYAIGTGNNIEQCYVKGVFDVGNSHIAFNGLMPELADMYNDGDLATVNNIGTLVQPFFKGDSVNRQPPQLMGHNNQRKLQQNGNSGELFSDGWASRLAFAMEPDSIGPNVSLCGAAQIMQGGSEYISLNPVKPDKFNINSSLNIAHNYNDSIGNKIGKLLGSKVFESVDNTIELNNLWDTITFDGTNNYGDSLFTVPNQKQTQLENNAGRATNRGSIKGDMINGLHSVAKMIKIATSGLYYKELPTRQIFFVKVGGFDHHTAQDIKHAPLIREISLAMSDFKKAMVSMGLWDNVVVMSQTDFGRTALENNRGTDHAWSSHQFIAGGAVIGNQTFHGKAGVPTSLELGGVDDISEQGRYIPTTSIDQLFATVAKWYGLPDNMLDPVFPNLINFRSSNIPADSLIPGLIAQV